MIQKVIRVDPIRPGDDLDDKSLVDFSKVYTVEKYCRVHPYGKVNKDTLNAFLSLYNKATESPVEPWY